MQQIGHLEVAGLRNLCFTFGSLQVNWKRNYGPTGYTDTGEI